MINGVFVNKITGEETTIVKEDVNFYELDDNVRIKKDVFDKKYEKKAEIDPDAFFQTKHNITSDPLLGIANKIKGLDSTKVSDAPSGAQVKFIQAPIVLADNSMPPGPVMKPQVEETIHLSPEEKKAMLDEWRRTQPGAQIPEVQNKDWEDDERFLNGDKPIAAKIEPKVDPIQMMFKMFKNNYPVKLIIEIEENIPNPTFIEMVQENVDADAVDYYANLISDKLLKDPSKLKSEIYDQLKIKIFGETGYSKSGN